MIAVASSPFAPIAIVVIPIMMVSAAPDARAQKTVNGNKVAPPSPASAPAATPPAPVASDPVKAGSGRDAAPPPPPPPPSVADAPPNDNGEFDSSDVTEDPAKRYIFIGARYRGTVFPSFLLSPFVSDARGFFWNSAGIEADLRKDGFSLIPSLSYSEFGTDDVLYGDKTRPLNLEQNWGFANSSLKGIFAAVDLMWSVPFHKNFAFEYGFGVGVGAMFGDLIVNWVYVDPKGPLVNSSGTHYSQCNTQAQGAGGCLSQNHQNATTARVGRYSEPSWFSGGSKPSLFPYISIPNLGVRFKPIKQLEARLGVGFSLTGLWFQLSANYGLEHAPKN